MDRYRSYDGRRGSTRRRHSSTTRSNNDRSSRRAIKLFICVCLFVVAALMKLLFPSALTAIGDKLNTVVNYRAALTVLGEGISGEKKFTTALGEAFTYAFTGESVDASNKEEAVQTSDDKVPASDDQASSAAAASDSATVNDDALVTDTIVSDSNANDDATAVFSEDKDANAATDSEVPASEADASVTDNNESLSNAVIAAFMESQEEYSDFAIPAGVTYDMPRISAAYASPLTGEVSSSFGYRIHPTEKTVKFHYGTDICAKKGTPITAFADGKVIAAGESTTLGKYVVIYHGDVESQYAHCASISVTSGQTVKKGDKIATIGNTGNATETCLHFELKVNGQYVNPEYYVQWS